MNISSLIVDVQPGAAAAVRSELQRWPGVEVHAADARGKLVLTLETDTDAQTTDTFARIGALEGVMSLALAFHQIEPEPETEIRHDADAT
ncbi:MAG: chaperone NapD [Burkholderiaceae bacterium]